MWLILVITANMTVMSNTVGGWIMPATIQRLTDGQLVSRVQRLGLQVRQRRKAMRVSVLTAAQAAGMSRDTWQRMEKGQVTVTIGAWFNALAVLGLEFGIGVCDEPASASAPADEFIPCAVRLADYPQLAALAWQLRGSTELSARAAFDIYERNERHLDREKLTPEEARLIAGLKRVFADDRGV